MNTTLRNSKDGGPWYCEPWPWFLASGPLLVVVASIVSAWVAIRSSDGLVSEDYYRAGLAAEETISRSKRAETLGLSAQVRMDAESLSIVLTARDASYRPPPALRVTLSHPTRAGLDQELLLLRQADRYVARQPLPATGHWLLLIADDAGSWRMMGSMVLPVRDGFTIGEPK